MNSDFILGPSKLIYKIEENFPKTNKKVGVFLSGGLESCLVSLIAFDVYGKDNVICFYSDNIFSNNNETLNRYIRTNIKRAAALLNTEPEYLEFDYQLHVKDRKSSVEINIEKIRKKYNIDFTLWGFTKLFFEVEPFKQQGLTLEQVVSIALSDREKFKHTIEEFHLETGEYSHYLLDIDIPAEVYPLLRGESEFILSPFKNLNKCEVIDLYRQLDWLDKAYQTSSCILESISETGKHCGTCFNCQQRYDAFRILNIKGIDDKTPYASDLIVHRRARLEEIKNASHT
jgi:hypothetical protein